jgi:PPOX class probable F420-dependent enzyme
MNDAEARAYLAANTRGVLATLRRNGRPQLSNVLYVVDDDGKIRISSTRDRAKVPNIRRDPRASLAVIGDNFWQYVVAEGHGSIEEGPTLAADLRRVYVKARGEQHPDWNEFDAAMIAEKRVLIAIAIERLYPLS